VIDDDDIIGVGILNGSYLEIDCNDDQAYELKEYFSCYATDYQNNPKYKAHQWDGKISFFSIHDRTLPMGLIKYLKPFLQQFKYKVDFYFDFEDLKNDISKEDLTEFYNILFDGVTTPEGHPIYPRDYQQDAIYAAIRNKRCVLESATGSGKSIMIYTLTRFVMADTDGKVLVIVPSINLVNQLYNDFKEYGWVGAWEDVSLLHGKSKHDPSKQVTISTWQSLYKKPYEFFEEFEGVLVDETHGARSLSIRSILEKCDNAEYKIGVTGTLPDDKADKFNIYGFLGPLRYQLKSKTLIDKGFLSNIKIVNLIMRYHSRSIDRVIGSGYSNEVSYIMKHPLRQYALKYIIDNVNDKHNILILSHRIDHIKSIVEMLKKEYPDKEILVTHGKTSPKERERIRNYMETVDGAILVASYGTLSTGVNIPKLHHVIFASFYKSKIKVLQSIGRGLRKHKSKKKVVIWDLVDDLRKKKANGRWQNNYAYVHFYKRIKYYKHQEFEYINKRIDIYKFKKYMKKK